jgi:D-sedoheptulose 7-phosphate isomerase
MTNAEDFNIAAEVATYLTTEADLLARLPQEPLAALVQMVIDTYESGGKLITMGNGGHGATASHLVNDMGKHLFVTDDRTAFVVKEKGFRTLCLNDSWATLTAWANDMGYDSCFAAPLANWVEPNDLVLGISGSGNSPNVLKAFEVARQAGAKTVCLSGRGGGKAREVADLVVTVPSDNVLQVEDAHMTIAHLCTEVVRKYVQRNG